MRTIANDFCHRRAEQPPLCLIREVLHYGLCNCGTLYWNEGHRLRGCLPGGLHSSWKERIVFRFRGTAVYRSGGVHRLWRMRAGLPRIRHFCARRPAGQMEALCRDQREALRTLRKECEESTIVGLHQKEFPPCSKCNSMWIIAVSKGRCSNWQSYAHRRSTVVPIVWTCIARICVHWVKRSNGSRPPHLLGSRQAHRGTPGVREELRSLRFSSELEFPYRSRKRHHDWVFGRLESIYPRPACLGLLKSSHTQSRPVLVCRNQLAIPNLSICSLQIVV